MRRMNRRKIAWRNGQRNGGMGEGRSPPDVKENDDTDEQEKDHREKRRKNPVGVGGEAFPM